LGLHLGDERLAGPAVVLDECKIPHIGESTFFKIHAAKRRERLASNDPFAFVLGRLLLDLFKQDRAFLRVTRSNKRDWKQAAKQKAN